VPPSSSNTSIPIVVETGTPTPLEAEARILAFVNDEESADALRMGLMPYANDLAIHTGGIRQAVRHLQKVTLSGMVIVDLEGVDDAQIELDNLARVCPPDVQVVALGNNTEIGFYRLLVHELGVTEYLPKPLTRDSVQQFILRQLSSDHNALPPVRGGRVIAVCGARGGVGTTTIAVSLAWELSQVTKGHVALVDLHLQNGSAAVMLGGRPGPGFWIALEDPTRADALFLERTAIVAGPRLRLIAAEEGLESSPNISETGVARVLDLLRQKFNFIVVDLPIPVPPAMLQVIGVARHVVVVLRPDVTGLRDAKAIRRFVTAVTGSDRVITVVNRSDAKGALPAALIREGLGLAPEVMIPDLGMRMAQTLNMGVPAVQRVPAFRRHLAPIVREVAGVRTTVARGLLARMFRR
jgi:pilus assembly protein CpaE